MSKKPENNRNSIGRFVEGSSGNPNGRPLGSKNKFTTLKNTFIEAFEELGEVDNLVEWARGQPDRVLPDGGKADTKRGGG